MSSKDGLSIWLVVGVSFLVNGLLILGAGIYEYIYPPEQQVALFQYHASIWWGGLMTLLGLIYCVRFMPRRQKASVAAAAGESHGK